MQTIYIIGIIAKTIIKITSVMGKSNITSLIIFCFLTFLTYIVKGQDLNPLPALKVFQYDTDNNLIDIDKETQGAKCIF